MLRVAALMLLFAASTVEAEDLPVPPVPPAHVPTPDAAPVPDQSNLRTGASSDSDPNVQLRFFRSSPPDPSAGFTPGSRFQTPEERKPIQTPGLSLSVPIQ
jgi:hypothetical protein